MPPPPTPDHAAFPSTCWSKVRIAPGAASTAARAAFATLAQQYLAPIRAWLAATLTLRGDELDDLVQDFFVWSIDSRLLAKVDPARGSFRAFLKTALRNYATDRARRAQARKRGGAVRNEPLDGAPDAARALPDARAARPDQELDAAWRAQVVARAVDTLGEQLTASGRAAMFAVFRDYFLAADDAVDYRTLAARHGITPVDVSNWLSRAKSAYRERLRAEVLATVASLADLDGELRWLLAQDAP